MSEDKSFDKGEIEDAKSGLAHVEPEKKDVTTHPVFKCEKCSHTEDIPKDVLDKMEADETVDPPEHCGEKMKISVVA
ncbi:MAG: hypothetical protein OEY49_16280 [Candidatus Heimdallarchaeota archaeon]|nr:hypothetical protein [Candidatus Heimdallarchaeota archaeon]